MQKILTEFPLFHSVHINGDQQNGVAGHHFLTGNDNHIEGGGGQRQRQQRTQLSEEEERGERRQKMRRTLMTRCGDNS